MARKDIGSLYRTSYRRHEVAVFLQAVRRKWNSRLELFKRTAKHIDDMAVIRSMYAEVPNHEPSLMLMNCGDMQLPHRSGSWVTYGLEANTTASCLKGYLLFQLAIGALVQALPVNLLRH